MGACILRLLFREKYDSARGETRSNNGHCRPRTQHRDTQADRISCALKAAHTANLVGGSGWHSAGDHGLEARSRRITRSGSTRKLHTDFVSTTRSSRLAPNETP